MSAVLKSRQSVPYTPERQILSLFDCIVPVTTSSVVTNQCNVISGHHRGVVKFLQVYFLRCADWKW